MIQVNYRDARPIYEQVKEQFRRTIIAGGLLPGEKMPSVRELAQRLAINPNTIQRAYRELEAEGYIYSVAGKGSFVSEGYKADNERREELFRLLEDTAAELLFLGVSREELLDRIREVQE